MFEKITIITLLYLTPMGDIKQHSFEIPSKESCSSWFEREVKVNERKKRKLLTRQLLLQRYLTRVSGAVSVGKLGMY